MNEAMAPAIGTDTADREILLTRVYDAPRELVFDAWTHPEHVARWWGPRGFTITTHEMDVRAGGAWRFIMHGPDGTDYDNEIIYTEVTRPERLIYGHGQRDGIAWFNVSATFIEEDGKTRVTMHTVFPTAEARTMAIEQRGAIEGAKQTMERLAEFLAAR